MMKKSWTLFLSLVWLSFACGESLKEENKTLKDEVIAIHDEVMPLMGELKNNQKQVEKKISQADSLGITAEELARLQSISLELGAAFEGMFVWMRQFKSSYEDMTEEQIHDYLLDQKTKVEKVNVDIKDALDTFKTAYKEE